MPVVSFRLSEDELQRLEAIGETPGPFAKALVQRELRKLDIERDLARLKELSKKPSKPVEEIIRDIRDER